MLLVCNTVLNGQFSCMFENRDTIFHMEEFSMMLLELKDYVGIDVDIL